MPCTGCTQAMFCSTKCFKEAEIYHKYECKLLKTIRELNVDKMKLIALKMAFKMKDDYKNICSDLILSPESNYRSDRYKEIHNLVGNTQHRTVPDLFKRTTAATVLYYLVDTFTTFFDDENEKTTFKEVLLLHMQTASCNFHEISEMCSKNGVFEPKEIGAGAFSFLSMFNHSCNPNVVRQCFGTTIVLRAIKTIQAGTQCFDNYG